MAAAEKEKKIMASHSTDLLHLPRTNDKSKFLVKKTKSQENGPPRTFRMETSSVLNRLKDFLPQMEKANKKLENDIKSKPASELDIETVSDSGPYIEMNLAVVERDSDGSSSSSNESDDNISEHQDESIDEIRTEYVGRNEVTEENFVISRSKRSKCPVIEEMDSNSNSNNNNNTDNNNSNNSDNKNSNSCGNAETQARNKNL